MRVGDTQAASVEWRSDSSMRLTVAPGQGADLPLQFSYSTSDSQISASITLSATSAVDQLYSYQAPEIQRVVPSSAPSNFLVTILGRNFGINPMTGSKVGTTRTTSVCRVPCQHTWMSDSSISVRTPPLVPVTTVTTGDGITGGGQDQQPGAEEEDQEACRLELGQPTQVRVVVAGQQNELIQPGTQQTFHFTGASKIVELMLKSASEDAASSWARFRSWLTALLALESAEQLYFLPTGPSSQAQRRAAGVAGPRFRILGTPREPNRGARDLSNFLSLKSADFVESGLAVVRIRVEGEADLVLEGDEEYGRDETSAAASGANSATDEAWPQNNFLGGVLGGVGGGLAIVITVLVTRKRWSGAARGAVTSNGNEEGGGSGNAAIVEGEVVDIYREMRERERERLEQRRPGEK